MRLRVALVVASCLVSALTGLVLSRGSPRDLAPERAADLGATVGPFQTAVFVTSETRGDEIAALVAAQRPTAVQLPAAAGPYVFAALKARFPHTRLFASVRPRDAGRVSQHADVLVLDALDGDSGGTGRTLDWDEARASVEAAKRPVLLAGGLTPENVAEAIACVRPWGVDVSSGVESAGVKDPERVRAFVRAARAAALQEGLD